MIPFHGCPDPIRIRRSVLGADPTGWNWDPTHPDWDFEAYLEAPKSVSELMQAKLYAGMARASLDMAEGATGVVPAMELPAIASQSLDQLKTAAYSVMEAVEVAKERAMKGLDPGVSPQDVDDAMAEISDLQQRAQRMMTGMQGLAGTAAVGWVDFPAWEIPGLREQLEERGFFFSTRVSDEVGKYRRGQVWNSPLGPLFVVISFHYDRLEDVPYYPEIVQGLLSHSRQLDELRRLAGERGVDVVVWSRPPMPESMD